MKEREICGHQFTLDESDHENEGGRTTIVKHLLPWRSKRCYISLFEPGTCAPGFPKLLLSTRLVWCGVVWCGVVWCGVCVCVRTRARPSGVVCPCVRWSASVTKLAFTKRLKEY